MINNVQLISLYTITRREVGRMFRIATQVFLPPIITTTLYFIIFGKLIGSRVGTVNGVSYMEFIVPGLIMMSVITNSYTNVATSLFSIRFQKNIEEILISPTHDWIILLGFCLGGIIRGCLVALLVFFVSRYFVSLDYHSLSLTMFVVVIVSGLFALAGYTNAMVARTFDDVALVPTFVLTPLTYLGGVFYTMSMLSPFWQKVSAFNPIFYMINAFRYAMIGYDEVNFQLCITVIILTIVGLTALNFYFMKKGLGLRE